jgi:hypothetical protein
MDDKCRYAVGANAVPEIVNDAGNNITVVYLNKELDEFTSGNYEEKVKGLLRDRSTMKNIALFPSLKKIK